MSARRFGRVRCAPCGATTSERTSALARAMTEAHFVSVPTHLLVVSTLGTMKDERLRVLASLRAVCAARRLSSVVALVQGVDGESE